MAERWTPEQDAILKGIYPRNSKAFILNKLSLPWMAIRRRALRLNLHRDKDLIDADRTIRTKTRSDGCTPEEKILLQKVYAENFKKDILPYFPNRSWKSIFRFAKILGLKRNPEIVKQEMIEAGSSANNCRDDLWTEEEDTLLKQIYSAGTQKELEENFPNRTFRGIRIHANTLGLRREEAVINKDRTEHTKASLQANFGVDCSFQIPSVQKKSRKTCLENHGVLYPMQSKKIQDRSKQTVQDRYGVDNVFQAEDIKEQSKSTCIELYGTPFPMQNKEIKERGRQTCLKNLGVENPFQRVDLVQQGMLDKHGVKNPSQHPEIRKQIEETCIERYGFPVSTQNKNVQEKFKQTCIEKYGFSTPFLHPEIKEQIRQTNLIKYGTCIPIQTEEIKEKMRQTNLKRYGVSSLLQLKEIRDMGWVAVKKNKSFTKSKEEIDFLDYLRLFDPNTEHHVDHPQIKHNIDFYMPFFDLWVQYDGVYWHGKLKRMNSTRQALKIQRTIARDQYQNETIPNLIRFWSDDVIEAINNDTILSLIEKTIESKISAAHQFLKKQEHLQEDLKNLTFDPKELKA
jgi:hypothetical protein